jgi:hypothetical protein
MIPHDTAKKLIQYLGVNFFSTRLLGISNVTYVTKRIDTAIWNCPLVR